MRLISLVVLRKDNKKKTQQFKRPTKDKTVKLVWAACSVVVKLTDLDLQGRWFNPWCGQDKISTAVGPLSKALNPTLLQGVMSPD